MIKIRTITLGLVTAIAISAVASAPASAAKCNVKKTKWVFCTEGNELPETMFPVGTSGISKLFSSVAGVGIEIRCQKATRSLEQCNEIWKVNSKHERIEQLKKCSVNKETITPTALPALVNTPPTPPEEEYTGIGTEKIYAEITIEGSECAIKVTKGKLTGSQKCTFDTTFETEKEEHEVICNPSGSKLKFGSAVAESEFTIRLHLENKHNWSVKTN
jgi:hypothetical protein